MLLEPADENRTKLTKANADQVMTARIAGLKEQGVKFEVCANTLKGKKINADRDLYDVKKTDIVPSGVAEVAKLQSQGYAYIKP
jgi:hypothetical protein